MDPSREHSPADDHFPLDPDAKKTKEAHLMTRFSTDLTAVQKRPHSDMKPTTPDLAICVQGDVEVCGFISREDEVTIGLEGGR